MRILAVNIQNFRGISSGQVRFHTPHVLLVGSNNACKSTVLEALDLALNPDRSYGAEVIDEHDFFQGRYLQNGEGESAPKIAIEVILGDLTDEELRSFRRHVEAWNREAFRPYTPEELETHAPTTGDFVLRIGFEGWYDEDEDEFTTSSFFLVPAGPDGERDPCGRKRKQEIGFLYLRALRTARRAASLQRGSLLDLLLRSRASRAHMWQTVLERVEEAGQGVAEIPELEAALGEIRRRIDQLIPLARTEPGSSLHAGRLTRRHLRETMTYFLASRDSGHLLPFDRLGSGTSNVLVFALLTAIAEAKDNVIFAMEEPEIALAPHTQRLMVERLRRLAAQSIVTSHSPYVAELFLPDNLVVTRRTAGGTLDAPSLNVESRVKEKTLRQEFRSRFAEGLLANAVALVEGFTELWAIPTAVARLAAVPGTAVTSFDVEGLVFVQAGGEGDLDKFAEYFGSIGIPAHVICDELPPARITPIEQAATTVFVHGHHGFEALIAEELPAPAVVRIVTECQGWENCPGVRFPAAGDPEQEWRRCLLEVIKGRKGEGWGARVLDRCAPQEFPASLLRMVIHLRAALGLDPLPHDDPLAPLFGGLDAGAVRPAPEPAEGE